MCQRGGGGGGLAFLSAMEQAELHRAVAMADKAVIGRANGVGTKLAARIVNELKDKSRAAAIGSALAAGSTAVPVSSHAADAVSALQNLGFHPAEASTAVAAAEEELGGGATLDALVRLALKKAAK